MPQRLQIVTTGFAGGPAYNTYYQNSTLPADAQILVDELLTYYNGMDSHLQNSVTVTCSGEVETFDVATGKTTGITSINGWSVNGSWGTGAAPGGTCLVVQYRTGIYQSGRELRGRHFISGLGDIGAGSPGVPAGIWGNVTVLASALVEDASLQVWSPTKGIIAPISSAKCWDKFGLMRSRRD